jgi:palmitoyltransferase ZDHHC9/14/18
MAGRPGTARSEISSAISDGISEDAHGSRPPTGSRHDQPSIPNPPRAQHGFSHLRGVTPQSNRAVRSPPPAPPSTTGSSRPQSPMSTTSRTHVPSLTAQGFFRPMSSQKLQAQRYRRPTESSRGISTPAPIPDSEYGEEDDQSVASSRHPMPKGHRPMQSVTTDYTQSEMPENYDTVSHDYVSQQEGESGLVDGSRKAINRPMHLNLSAAQRNSDAPQKSPLSFRSGFSLASKSRLEPGHQHLSSNTTSVRNDHINHQRSTTSKLQGKNHEYFEGNTVFWWGGRMQNARDRPVNVATGIFLILPAILFFVFS